MHLMRRIQLFLKRADMAPTRFGREVVKDPRFVSDLRMGRAVGDDLADRVHAWLDRQEGRR